MDEHRLEVPSQSSEQNETSGASQPHTLEVPSQSSEQNETSGASQPHTDTKFICRLMDHVRNQKLKAYVPQVVSLGPFHQHNPQLAKHETLKKQHLVPQARVASFDKLVDDIILPEIKLIERLYSITERECTHEYERELGRMMARDGLFLLRFLKKMHPTKRPKSMRAKSMRAQLFEPKFQIQQDIMKLENQIPFFVVNMVFKWEADTVKDFRSTLKRCCQTLCPFPNIHVRVDLSDHPNSHLLGFMYDNIMARNNIINSSGHSTCPYHTEHTLLRRMTSIISLLKALWRMTSIISLLKALKVGQNQMSNDKDNSLLSAAELEGKGVNFTAIKSPLALDQIRFDDISCRFYLPIIEMYSTTDVVMRNLLAFELYVCKGGTKPLRCYIDLMERLIDNVEDVKVLKDAGIIRNHLSNDKVVANVWNAMQDVLDQDEKGKYEPIGTAIKDVRDFYSNKYRTMWAKFMYKYFSLALFVGFFSLALQTIFSVLQTFIAWEQLRLQRKSM